MSSEARSSAEKKRRKKKKEEERGLELRTILSLDRVGSVLFLSTVSLLLVRIGFVWVSSGWSFFGLLFVFLKKNGMYIICMYCY